MSLITGTRAQAVGLSVLSKKLSRLHTACPGICLFDLQQSKDRKYLMSSTKVSAESSREPFKDMQVLKYLPCHLMSCQCTLYNTLFFSSKETQWFLKKMNNVSESDCDCLPDCELTEFQHSHSITNLM